jgi:hypothetical protein
LAEALHSSISIMYTVQTFTVFLKVGRTFCTYTEAATYGKLLIICASQTTARMFMILV